MASAGARVAAQTAERDSVDPGRRRIQKPVVAGSPAIFLRKRRGIPTLHNAPGGSGLYFTAVAETHTK